MSTLLADAVAASSRLPMQALDSGDRPSVARTLNAIRVHLGMDVAFVSEFLDGRRYFRHVDARNPAGPVQVGISDALDDSYCYRVFEGRLPELMHDACQNAEALTLAVTRALPVGAHLSVPIRFSDGRVYGTLCCFSHTANLSLNGRDLGMMRVFAEMIGEQVQDEALRMAEMHSIAGRVEQVLDSDALSLVYQPIFNIIDGRRVGFEALARISAQPYQTPDVWFADAARVGRALDLETKAMRLVLKGLETLPGNAYVALNASPAMIVNGNLAEVLRDFPLERIVVEVTEHQAVERYEDIAGVIRPLQEAGLRLAIDDAGAGYASFRHILNLRPDIVKLDISITRSIDTDRSRRALAAALRGFAFETGCSIVAEGIETSAELEALKNLGITKAQGFFLGRPMTQEQLQATIH